MKTEARLSLGLLLSQAASDKSKAGKAEDRMSAETGEDFSSEGARGPEVMPGEYQVQLSRRVDGVETPLSEPQRLSVFVEGVAAMAETNRKKLVEFQN